jgi:threonine dehydratase
MFERDADLLTLEARPRRGAEALSLAGSLRLEIHKAKARVYRLASATPLEMMKHPRGLSFHIKREDLSPVHSYKWRGAMNRLALLAGHGVKQVVCASAGNHSQGVALAAHALGMYATIFMPLSAQELKVQQSRKLLGQRGTVVLVGETFDDALQAAKLHAKQIDAEFIAPFDDVHVMAGQGTIGLEILQACPHPGTVYLQIGGGGMAAGVACALKAADPGIRVVGVEAENQASMTAALSAGAPVLLDEVDHFCDGTAVREAGKLTHALCRELLDDVVTVTNDEVRTAIKFLWNEKRIVPEPSGALGLAALLREDDPRHIEHAVVVMSGSNMDFSRLAALAS